MSLTGIGEVAGLATSIIDKIWPNKTEQEKAELQAALVVVQGQLAVNRAEAGSSSVFVAGWRPFIGWCCGGAFAYHYILQPFIAFVLSVFGVNVLLPSFDMDTLMTVLLGMLGLGGMRSFEKIKMK